MTSKERYHNDAEYRERVKAKAKRWQEKNPNYKTYAYLKKKIREMKIEELKEYIKKHSTLVKYAKEECERRVSC